MAKFLVKIVRSLIVFFLKMFTDDGIFVLPNAFAIPKKCHGKLGCLVYNMLLMRNKRPTLNTQKDFILAKLFILLFYSISFLFEKTFVR